eukprot:TRINITY_DN225_c0_g1_i1.p1 TRINITY_DN225_c0_g1~~TRINITY_DN225_c0_g1_i1.p1  ORF type:complete len:623 (-),score=171.61 TRINITY_DN225_c0_g1_i1:42-1841(-)
MNYRLFSLALVLFISSAYSVKVKFHVACEPPATNVQVSVLGSTYTLTAPFPDVPYFNGSVDLTYTGNLTYKYIKDNVAESFVRVLEADDDSTHNDFFGRMETMVELYQLGWPFTTKQHWTRGIGSNGIYNEEYIATIYFTGPAAQAFFTAPYGTLYQPEWNNLTVTFINKKSEGHWDNVTVKGRHTSEAKTLLKVKLNENYKKRSNFKLRPSNFDPAFIREKIYNDVLEALGCPHSMSVFTRVYVNGSPLGLYNLQEETSSRDFIKATFYGTVERPDPIGTPLECATGADFSINSTLSAFQAPDDLDNSKIVQLLQATNDLDITSDAAIAAFDQNWFDIEYFFRAIAMEYLSGHYDSYWMATTNYVLYDDPTQGPHRWTFIDQDFDQTHGVNLAYPYNEYGRNYTQIPYTAYVNKTWNLIPYDAPHRTMIDKLLSNPTYRARFETVLKTIVQQVWNPIALYRRIDSVAARIRPEVAWDRSLGDTRIRNTSSDVQHWTLADFDNNLDSTFVFGNWGLKQYISERANFIASQFDFQFQDPPLQPPADTDDDEDSTTGTDGSDATSGNDSTPGVDTVDPESSGISLVASVVLATILTLALAL